MKTHLLRVAWAGAVVVVAATAAVAAPVVVDFDTPGGLVNNFSLNVNNSIPIKYFQVGTGGLGNSGAVDLFGTEDADHTTAVYNQSAYDFSQVGSSVTVSQFVLRQNALITQTPFVMLGILSDVGQRMDGGTSSNSYASIRLNPSTTATSTDVFLQTETKVAGGGRVRTTPGISVSMIDGNWYRVSATFTYNSASDLLISAVLEDWGAAGAALQSTLFSYGPTSVGLSGFDQINGDSSVWPAFRAFSEGGSNLLDNFSVVPEPTTLGLLLIAALGTRRFGRRA